MMVFAAELSRVDTNRVMEALNKIDEKERPVVINKINEVISQLRNDIITYQQAMSYIYDIAIMPQKSVNQPVINPKEPDINTPSAKELYVSIFESPEIKSILLKIDPNLLPRINKFISGVDTKLQNEEINRQSALDLVKRYLSQFSTVEEIPGQEVKTISEGFTQEDKNEFKTLVENVNLPIPEEEKKYLREFYVKTNKEVKSGQTDRESAKLKVIDQVNVVLRNMIKVEAEKPLPTEITEYSRDADKLGKIYPRRNKVIQLDTSMNITRQSNAFINKFYEGVDIFSDDSPFVSFAKKIVYKAKLTRGDYNLTVEQVVGSFWSNIQGSLGVSDRIYGEGEQHFSKPKWSLTDNRLAIFAYDDFALWPEGYENQLASIRQKIQQDLIPENEIKGRANKQIFDRLSQETGKQISSLEDYLAYYSEAYGKNISRIELLPKGIQKPYRIIQKRNANSIAERYLKNLTDGDVNISKILIEELNRIINAGPDDPKGKLLKELVQKRAYSATLYEIGIVETGKEKGYGEGGEAASEEQEGMPSTLEQSEGVDRENIRSKYAPIDRAKENVTYRKVAKDIKEIYDETWRSLMKGVSLKGYNKFIPFKLKGELIKRNSDKLFREGSSFGKDYVVQKSQPQISFIAEDPKQGYFDYSTGGFGNIYSNSLLHSYYQKLLDVEELVPKILEVRPDTNVNTKEGIENLRSNLLQAKPEAKDPIIMSFINDDRFLVMSAVLARENPDMISEEREVRPTTLAGRLNTWESAAPAEALASVVRKNHDINLKYQKGTPEYDTAMKNLDIARKSFIPSFKSYHKTKTAPVNRKIRMVTGKDVSTLDLFKMIAGEMPIPQEIVNWALAPQEARTMANIIYVNTMNKIAQLKNTINIVKLASDDVSIITKEMKRIFNEGRKQIKSIL